MKNVILRYSEEISALAIICNFQSLNLLLFESFSVKLHHHLGLVFFQNEHLSQVSVSNR